MNEQQSFIESVSTIIFWLSLVHILDAYLCCRWARLIRRPFLRRIFQGMGIFLAVASVARIIAYFMLPDILWLKLGFSYMGATIVVAFSALFALSTYVFEMRLHKLPEILKVPEHPLSINPEHLAKPTKELLGEALDKMVLIGRANHWL